MLISCYFSRRKSLSQKNISYSGLLFLQNRPVTNDGLWRFLTIFTKDSGLVHIHIPIPDSEAGLYMLYVNMIQPDTLWTFHSL